MVEAWRQGLTLRKMLEGSRREGEDHLAADRRSWSMPMFGTTASALMASRPKETRMKSRLAESSEDMRLLGLLYRRERAGLELLSILVCSIPSCRSKHILLWSSRTRPRSSLPPLRDQGRYLISLSEFSSCESLPIPLLSRRSARQLRPMPDSQAVLRIPQGDLLQHVCAAPPRGR